MLHHRNSGTSCVISTLARYDESHVRGCLAAYFNWLCFCQQLRCHWKRCQPHINYNDFALLFSPFFAPYPLTCFSIMTATVKLLASFLFNAWCVHSSNRGEITQLLGDITNKFRFVAGYLTSVSRRKPQNTQDCNVYTRLYGTKLRQYC